MGVHHSASWLFEPAKRLGSRANYCPGYSFDPKCEPQVNIFTTDWIGTRPLADIGGDERFRPNEHSQRTGPVSKGEQFSGLRQKQPVRVRCETESFELRAQRCSVTSQWLDYMRQRVVFTKRRHHVSLTKIVICWGRR